MLPSVKYSRGLVALLVLFCFFSFSLSTCTSHAKTIRELNSYDATCKPKGFSVVLRQSIRNELFFCIVNNGKGKAILSVRSSYQCEEPEENDFNINHTAGSLVWWHKSGHLLVIEEAVHNYFGELFLVAITSPNIAKEIDLPKSEIVSLSSKNLAYGGYRWERYYLGMGEWLGTRKLVLKLVGRVWKQAKVNEAMHSYTEASFLIVLRIDSHLRAIVESVKRVSQ